MLKKGEIETLKNILCNTVLNYSDAVKTIIKIAIERNLEREDLASKRQQQEDELKEKKEKLDSFNRQGFDEDLYPTLYYFHNKNYPSEIIHWFNKHEIQYFSSKDIASLNLELADEMQRYFDEKLREHLFDADDCRDQQEFDK